MSAMPGTPPSPLPDFAAMIWGYGLGNLGRNIEHLYEFEWDALTPDTLNWRRLVARAENMESDDTADDVACTFDLVNFTGGQLDPTWTDSDFTSAFTQIEFICNQWCTYMCARYRWNKIDAYVMEFNPEWPDSDPALKIFPFKLTGPPEKSHTLNNQGNSSGTGAGQLAFSVTEEVPVRRNWGRFYLPGVASAWITTSGHFVTSAVSAMANHVHQAYFNLSQTELFPCVPATYSQKHRIAALNNVTGVRVDDVPDVIRRRRPVRKTYEAIAPVAQQQPVDASAAGS